LFHSCGINGPSPPPLFFSLPRNPPHRSMIPFFQQVSPASALLLRGIIIFFLPLLTPSTIETLVAFRHGLVFSFFACSHAPSLPPLASESKFLPRSHAAPRPLPAPSSTISLNYRDCGFLFAATISCPFGQGRTPPRRKGPSFFPRLVTKRLPLKRATHALFLSKERSPLPSFGLRGWRLIHAAAW